jgi:hypothetical protein
MNILYKANAVAVGGRGGIVHVDNTPIHFEMALPRSLAAKRATVSTGAAVRRGLRRLLLAARA